MDVEVGEALSSRWENSYLIFAETYDDAPAPLNSPVALPTVRAGAARGRWSNVGLGATR